MSEISEEVRKEFKEGDDIRDAGLTTPEEIVRYDDILYGEDAQWQKLDVYRRKDAGDSLQPVIVSVHGGGWVYGDKERYQYYCMELALHGFAVVNFTYRLAPEHKFPAPLEDTNLVFGWMKENGAQYGLDLENVFAVGDSAGGNTLGLYAAIWTNPEYARLYPFQIPEGIRLRGIALNCGDYRVEAAAKEFERTDALMQDYLPRGGTKEELKMISVPDHVTSYYPPTFLMTSTGDFLKAQASFMAQKFVEQDVPFIYRFYGNRENPLPHVFHCNIRTEDAKLCNEEECEFFKKLISEKENGEE